LKIQWWRANWGTFFCFLW